MSRIVLHIDRLLLHGIDPSDAEAFAHALQLELRSRLATPGTSSRLTRGHLGRLRVGAVRVQQAEASQLGQTLAGHIAEGIVQ